MSAISVRCPGCHRRLAAPPAANGRTLSCPNCRGPVTVVAEGHTVVTDGAPDFSYLREQATTDDDILVADDAEDGESALGQSTARRPATPTATGKLAAPTPPPVIYTPPPVPASPAANPFAELANGDTQSRKKLPPLPAEPSPPPSKARRGPVTAPPTTVGRPPRWVWPVIVALAVYAALATGVGAWGWVRALAPDATSGKPIR